MVKYIPDIVVTGQYKTWQKCSYLTLPRSQLSSDHYWHNEVSVSRAWYQYCHKWPILGGGCKPEHPFTAILISCSRGTCLIVTYVHNCYMCSKLSHMVTVVTFSQNCNICLKLSHVVTIVTCCHNCHLWSQLSPVVTIVTCGHNCHMWSQLSHVFITVTCAQNCHIWSQLSHVVKIVTCGQNCHI